MEVFNLKQQVQPQQQQAQSLNMSDLGLGQQVESIEANKGYTFEEQFKQLYELSNDPKRKEFLDDLFQFMADRNQPVNRIPIMAKQVLDLYELYNLVVARGGLVEVINKKIWREITKGLNLPSSITSAAFTLRTQYMKYLYPYECAKNNFSRQDELQQAIDGNRREGRRAGSCGGATNLAAGFASYLGGSAGGGGADSAAAVAAAAAQLAANSTNGNATGQYSASPSPNHLFSGRNVHLGPHQAQPQQRLQHHSSSQQQQQQHQQQHHHHQRTEAARQALQQLQQDLRERQQMRRSASSSPNPISPSYNNHDSQRLYQDSIESDHDDETSIDLGHLSKRSSPVEQDQQHLDSHNLNNHGNLPTHNLIHHSLHNHHLLTHQQAPSADSMQVSHQQQNHQQFAAAAAAAAALRQHLGAAFNFAGNQNLLGQLAGQAQNPCLNPMAGGTVNQVNSGAGGLNNLLTSNNDTNSSISNSQATNQAANPLKQQQEQIIAALMAAANNQQPQQQAQQQPQLQSQPSSALPNDQQAAARAALSMMASNALVLTAPNAPDAMAIAATAQALGVKGAFIILLL